VLLALATAPLQLLTERPSPPTSLPLQSTTLLLLPTVLLHLATALLLLPTVLLHLATALLLLLMVLRHPATELLRNQRPPTVLLLRLRSRNPRELMELHHPLTVLLPHTTLPLPPSTNQPQLLPTTLRLPPTVVKRSPLDCMNVWITLIGSTF